MDWLFWVDEVWFSALGEDFFLGVFVSGDCALSDDVTLFSTLDVGCATNSTIARKKRKTFSIFFPQASATEPKNGKRILPFVIPFSRTSSLENFLQTLTSSHYSFSLRRSLSVVDDLCPSKSCPS
mmetsp:Transcript_6405/g.27233  ORF Transcript_6405/g.27233 Transcript_6405/m.27233 type:complete len:125 (+) Transcript_6405:2993-3367(+)